MNYFDILLAKKLEDDRDPKVEGLSVTENGRYHEDGVVYDPVIVEVPEPTLISKSITANGNYSASADNADGYSSVSVNVPLPENAYLLKSIENVNIATFTDGTDNFVKSLEVAIEPQQEGSGDPSPTNIRPISGWDEVNVTRCGENLFDKATITENKIINNTTGEETVSYGRFSSDYIKVNPSTDYYASNVIKSAQWHCVFYYDKNKNYLSCGGLSSTGDTASGVVTTPSGCNYARLVGVTTYKDDVSFVVGNQPPTTYEPYNGQTYTIDLDGTRYGGKLDVVNGVLTITHEIKKVNTLNWYYLQNTFYTSSVGISADGSSDINSDFVCSFAKSVNKEWSQLSNNECTLRKNLYSQGYYSLCVKNTEYSDATDFKNSLDSTSEITFPLATPLTIQLTPTIVKSLQGENNFFASTGEVIKLQYWGKEQN